MATRCASIDQLAPRTHAYPCARTVPQRGLSLIELLVALAILSTALLAIAQLQHRSLQLLRDAQLHDAALRLAQDMAERIRANPAAASAGDYELPLDREPESVYACSGSMCAPSDMATFDQSTWHSTVRDALPNGLGWIKANDDGYQILVAWTPVVSVTANACPIREIGADQACIAVAATP